jgi:hypothetical protein
MIHRERNDTEYFMPRDLVAYTIQGCKGVLSVLQCIPKSGKPY